MKKVSIFFILLTITLITVDKKDFKDFLKDFFLMFVIFGVFYLCGCFIIGKIYRYHQITRLEREIAEIFTDDFFSNLKRDLAILKIKSEFQKISSAELCTDQSYEKTE